MSRSRGTRYAIIVSRNRGFTSTSSILVASLQEIVIQETYPMPSLCLLRLTIVLSPVG